MLTLFHQPRTRSSRFIWLLEELGEPYEIKTVTVRRQDGTGALDPNNPHPHGKVPAIKHNETIVFESSAMVLYLTDAFPKNKIGPAIGEPARGAYLTMLAYYCGVLEPAFMSKFMKTEVLRGTAGWVDADEAMAYVLGRLADGPYLLGDKFSGADILFASTLGMFLGGALLPKTDTLDAYVKRCTERPAAKRAQEKDSN